MVSKKDINLAPFSSPQTNKALFTSQEMCVVIISRVEPMIRKELTNDSPQYSIGTLMGSKSPNTIKSIQ